MALVTNYTDARVVIIGKDYRYELPPMVAGQPKPSVEVEDAHAEDWEGRTGWAAKGFVAIAGKRQHWRTAIAAIQEIADLDKLEAMHATEERPKVREALEERMRELLN